MRHLSFHVDDDVKEPISSMLERLADWDRLREDWTSFLHLVARYANDMRAFEAIPPFFESALKLMSRYTSHLNQHRDFILHEAFQYAISVFLKEQRFDAVALLLSFHYREPARVGSSQRFGIFSLGDTRYLKGALNETWSKQKGGTRYRYPQQQWLYSRTNENSIPFELLKEADVILWLRSTLEIDSDDRFSVLTWCPVTIGSFQDYHSRVDGFPIFQRAASRTFFDKFKVVLGVDSKEELVRRWASASKHDSDISRGNSGQYWGRVFNLEKLAST